VNYEAQAAIELEMAINEQGDDAAYSMDPKVQNSSHIIDTRPAFEQILQDLKQGMPVAAISGRFHNALIDVFTRLADVVRAESGLTSVCLSGGTFHNSYLLTGLQCKA
jgi:hydrogenase maturation protein HypF